MIEDSQFTKRVNYTGPILALLNETLVAYKLGDLLDYKIITVGYEDLNISVRTTLGKFLVKIFGSFRDLANCNRYVDIMEKVIKKGVSHPRLYSFQDNYLYRSKLGNNTFLCVMDFIDGQSFFDLNLRPTKSEAVVIIDEVSKINSLDISPDDYYDEWSPVNFVNEFKLKKKYLSSNELLKVSRLVKPFSNINLEKLPHCLVHGDIIRPNILKDLNSKIYIIDFSAAARKPRLQELAVLMCGTFFNEEDSGNFSKSFDLLIKIYKPKLSEIEIKLLPLFVRVVFAMYLLLGKYSKVEKGMQTSENNYWIKLGRTGLEYYN